MNALLSALEPPERQRLKEVLARTRREGKENHHDRLVRSALDRVEADLQALKDILGYGESGDNFDDTSDDSY